MGLSLEQQLAVRGHDRRLVAWLIVTGRVRPTAQYLIASRLRGRTRAEALNNNVKRIVRRAYGFHSARAALALIHLTCGPVPLALSRERTFA